MGIWVSNRSDGGWCRDVGSLDVDDEQLTAFCLRQQVKRLSLFGSVLRDDYGPDSDVDILVEFHAGKSVSLFDLVDMESELSPIFGGRRIDLRTPGELHPRSRQDVMEHAEVQYAEG